MNGLRLDLAAPVRDATAHVCLASSGPRPVATSDHESANRISPSVSRAQCWPSLMEDSSSSSSSRVAAGDGPDAVAGVEAGELVDLGDGRPPWQGLSRRWAARFLWVARAVQVDALG